MTIPDSTSRSLATKRLGLFVWFLVSFSAAGVGGLAVARGRPTWYLGLRKPSWTPPNSWFGPVWTVLYAAMAVSAWLIWEKGPSQPARVRLALNAFAVQLLLNTAWSWVFFGGRQPGWAFLEILTLWVAILVVIYLDWRVSRPAALILVPYLVWVTFATILNGAIWRLNS